MSFEQILEFIRSQNEFIIYGVLVASAFVENIFPPFPGDSITLAGAYLAGKGDIGYIGVLVSVAIGGLTGAMTLYYIGRTGGRTFFEKGHGKYLVKGNLDKIERLFARFGSGIILVSRFIPGVRSAIAVAAGIGNVNTWRMTGLTVVSILLWNLFLIGAMVYTKSNWRSIVDLVKEYNVILITIGIVILIAWIIRAIWLKRRNSK